MEWSLKELYTSFESESFTNDFKALEEKLEGFITWCEAISKNEEDAKQKLEDYITKMQEISYLVDKLGAFISLTLSTDSKNKEGIKYEAILENKMNRMAKPSAIMSQWISALPKIEEVIQSSELLQEHAFYVREIIRKHAHVLSEKEEEILARMSTTGSSAWVNYKNLLISMHKVEVELEGKKEEMTLTSLLNLAHHKDQEVRKKAYEAEIASYKKVEEGLAAALNGIKGEVLTTADLRGYASPLDMTLENSRMSKKTLDAMLEAMEENLPIFREYLKTKAKLLGHKEGLPFYDLYAPVIQKEMKFTYEEGKDFVYKNFSTFSKHLGDFAKNAFEKNWLDVYPKEGKRSGAFCRNIRSIKESRFLLNYGDSLSSVITMAHELGHGFHGECLGGESSLNTRYPMPLAETASTLCETIVSKAAIKEATKEEAFAILEEEISGATQVIVDIYSRYLFESALFEKREESPLGVEEIKNLMLDAQRKAYGDGLDPEYLHPYMWTWKPHYYYASTNFYNFPYAFGLLFAKGLYARYLQDTTSFPSNYETLLAVTGKMSIEEVARTMDIDVTDKAFWQESLRIVGEDIKAFVALSEEI
jgi:pepF/M3 family oligoendopeptidase